MKSARGERNACTDPAGQNSYWLIPRVGRTRIVIDVVRSAACGGSMVSGSHPSHLEAGVARRSCIFPGRVEAATSKTFFARSMKFS